MIALPFRALSAERTACRSNAAVRVLTLGSMHGAGSLCPDHRTRGESDEQAEAYGATNMGGFMHGVRGAGGRRASRSVWCTSTIFDLNQQVATLWCGLRRSFPRGGWADTRRSLPPLVQDEKDFLPAIAAGVLRCSSKNTQATPAPRCPRTASGTAASIHVHTPRHLRTIGVELCAGINEPRRR